MQVLRPRLFCTRLILTTTTACLNAESITMPAMAYLLTVLAALVHFASANFDLYRIQGTYVSVPHTPPPNQPNGFMGCT